jgi:shikimate kinase
MNVILIGYRGTGKTAVADLLAQRLGLQVVRLDPEIERLAGKSIPELVASSGWAVFRDLEEEVVRQASASDGQVIDCGGGVVEREANFDHLRQAGTVFWLQASVPTIVARIEHDDQRPSLTGSKSFTEEVAEVLRRRTPLYQRMAHHQVDTDALTIQQVADRIASIATG